MPQLYETYTFDKGINIKKRNTLLLQDGELVNCSGFVYDYDGVLVCRHVMGQGVVIDLETETGADVDIE